MHQVPVFAAGLARGLAAPAGRALDAALDLSEARAQG